MKSYECAICKGLVARGIKNEERFMSTRKEVRKHLREVHHLKGKKNEQALRKEDLGQSDITKNMIATEIK